MKISYVSDIHLEINSNFYSFDKEEGGDVLIFAGDIVPAKYMQTKSNDSEARKIKRYFQKRISVLCSKYKYVFYIMGNHEHYRYNFLESANTLQEAFQNLELPIELFDNNCKVIEDWLFIGSTLWTNYNKNNPMDKQIAWNHMNDYVLIGAEKGPFSPYTTVKATPDLFYNEHIKSMKYIEDTIKWHKKNTFIFTHMCPSFRSINQLHSINGLDPAYASDLSDFILDNPCIKYWVHGHTHCNFDYTIGQCRILANQRGYYNESSYKKFKGLQHIEI